MSFNKSEVRAWQEAKDEIARLRAELAEAREELRRISDCQRRPVSIARDFLAKHPEKP